jgi:hypothetical protein
MRQPHPIPGYMPYVPFMPPMGPYVPGMIGGDYDR